MKTLALDFGIEFEYLLVDRGGAEPGRIRDFTNLDYAWLAPRLAERPGCGDPALAVGDLGIRRGYWYIEGDERFRDDGSFRTMAVKGVEIRTPPRPGIAAAVASLLDIERQLAATLAAHELGLAIVAYNPLRPAYAFEPPLNPWESALRQRQRAYDGARVATLSYGPDLNISFPGWDARRGLAAARRLAACAPFIVPFSFSSPFYCGEPWAGGSKRTYERAGQRPLVKFFLPAGHPLADDPLVQTARLEREVGRIEFKAFDAFLSPAVLAACGYLLAGICLADGLRPPPGDPVALLRRGALTGFADDSLRRGAHSVLAAAARALAPYGLAGQLGPLCRLLAARTTPAACLLAAHCRDGRLYQPGGLADTAAAGRFREAPECQRLSA